MTIEKIILARVGYGTREEEIVPQLARYTEKVLIVAPRYMFGLWHRCLPNACLMSPVAYINGAMTAGFKLIIIDECQHPTWGTVVERAKKEVLPVWMITVPGPANLWQGTLPTAPAPGAGIPAEILERMRAVRLFHWREMKNLRRRSMLAETYVGTDAELATAYAYNKMANIHLGFVQSLNDLFPVDDTAENDDAQATSGASEST